MKTILATVAAAGVALSASSASAETVHVTYADLDLQTAAGQKTLESRIDRASRKACGYTIQGRGDLSAEQAVRSCFDKAKARANRQFAARADAAAMGG